MQAVPVMSERSFHLNSHPSWTTKNWCFWIVVLKKILQSPLDSKEVKPVNPKGNKSWIFIGRTDVEAEAPILGSPEWLTGKDPDAGKDWGQEEKGMTEDEMVGWHHRLNGHESEETPGDGKGQGSLACCSPGGHEESDTTEWLKNSNNDPSSQLSIYPFIYTFIPLSLYLYAVQRIVITWSLWSAVKRQEINDRNSHMGQIPENQGRHSRESTAPGGVTQDTLHASSDELWQHTGKLTVDSKTSSKSKPWALSWSNKNSCSLVSHRETSFLSPPTGIVPKSEALLPGSAQNLDLTPYSPYSEPSESVVV